jgi:hypothetical protein
MGHLRVEARSCVVCNGLDDGRVDSEGTGNATKTKCTVSIAQS